MTIHITAKNASKDFTNALKSLAKLADVKLTIQKEPSDELLRSIKAVKNGKVEKFQDFASYKKAMDSQMFEIHTTAKYKKQRKKLSQDDRDLLDSVIYTLASGESLEPKHRDHKLTGELKGFRECHIKPDLLLIYAKNQNALILTCVEVGSHSELFKGQVKPLLFILLFYPYPISTNRPAFYPTHLG